MVRSISRNALEPSARSTTPSGTRFPAGVGWATSTPPVRVVGHLRLVEDDDGVDQGEAVLPQARLAGRAPARGPADRRRELTGGRGFGEARRGAVPVALPGAVGPADQGWGFVDQVAQRPAYVVGALLVRQQQSLQLAGCGQAQLGESQQDLAADVRAGLRGRLPPGPGRFSRYISNGRRGVATRRDGRIRGLISTNGQTAARGCGAGRGARRDRPRLEPWHARVDRRLAAALRLPHPAPRRGGAPDRDRPRRDPARGRRRTVARFVTPELGPTERGTAAPAPRTRRRESPTRPQGGGEDDYGRRAARGRHGLPE